VAIAERSGWAPVDPVDDDYRAVRAGATLLIGDDPDVRAFPEELWVSATLERGAGSVRVGIPSPQTYPRPLVSRALRIEKSQPELTYAYLWLALPAVLPSVSIARRSILSSPMGRIDHGMLDERFTFHPPGRRGKLTSRGDNPRERAYDAHLRELFGPATDVLLDAPNVFTGLGIVGHRLYAVTEVDADRIEAAADLLLELRAALPERVLRRYGDDARR